ncbi:MULTISPECIES: hypothetical protein [Lactobacillaceae]|uniref:Uncharacterized protein n=1 Tax=Lactiplantibacillus daoliensis TaxID=2559916 RepID=A0ABW1UJD3_9LACO|nr:hypothetical protein [Pediococcus damnosus]
MITYNEQWHTFSEASKKVGKNRNYFFNRYRITPHYFDQNTIKVIGGVRFINDKGIESVMKNIKKMAARQSSEVL